MYRVLDNNGQYTAIHTTKNGALREIKDQEDYSDAIGQDPGPLFLQMKRDGEWHTIRMD